VLVRVAIASLLISAPARANACPPAVQLVGDAALVASVATALSTRGIALAPTECPVIIARVEHRDQQIVIIVDDVERVVREPETAASVIESFARDVDRPLLAIRPSPPVERRDRPSPPIAITAAPAAAPSPSGLHLFAGLESAVASDRTGWFGLHAGGCMMLGPICVAARLRSSAFENEDTRRHSWEMLFGIDIPFSVRGWLISPGFGFGPSGMATSAGTEIRMHANTNALRADAHATVTFPMTARFAFDVHVAANLLQRVHVDESDVSGVPDEPWGFFRVGVGLRYGQR
jgi:hypothetical protein